MIDSLRSDLKLRDCKIVDSVKIIDTLKKQLEYSEKLRKLLQNTMSSELETEKKEFVERKIALATQLENCHDSMIEVRAHLETIQSDNRSLDSLIRKLQQENERLRKNKILKAKSEETLITKVDKICSRLLLLGKPCNPEEVEKDSIIKNLKNELKMQSSKVSF